MLLILLYCCAWGGNAETCKITAILAVLDGVCSMTMRMVQQVFPNVSDSVCLSLDALPTHRSYPPRFVRLVWHSPGQTTTTRHFVRQRHDGAIRAHSRPCQHLQEPQRACTTRVTLSAVMVGAVFACNVPIAACRIDGTSGPHRFWQQATRDQRQTQMRLPTLRYVTACSAWSVPGMYAFAHGRFLLCFVICWRMGMRIKFAPKFRQHAQRLLAADVCSRLLDILSFGLSFDRRCKTRRTIIRCPALAL